MSRRLQWIVVSVGALATVAWWLWPSSEPHSADASTESPRSASNAPTLAAASHRPDTVKFETVLLPHEAWGASPNTVSIGVGRVSPDQARAYERWVMSGEEGAGPTKFSELAQIERWVTPPTQVREGGVLFVGPTALPSADRYDLRAFSTNPLMSYAVSFTAESVPVTVAPTLAAGLRVVRSAPPSSDVRLLFRRVVETPDAARWQALLAEQAPTLLTAFDDEALALNATSSFAPLPPGPLDLVLLVNGVESERRRVELVAGEWTQVRFDDVSQEVARAVAVDLELTFVVAGTTDPIEDVALIWHAERGDQEQISDATGRVRLAGVDRQRLHRFTLQFPTSDSELPIWPQTRPLELTLDETPDDASPHPLVRKTIEMTPLRWLDVRTGDFPVPVHRQGGNPYPIFVIQRERDGQWVDAASDHFLPIRGGMAVSVQQDGRYRVMALRSPWTVRYSSVATIVPDADARYPVDLLASPGHRVEVTVMREGQPLANAPIELRGPARGLPGATSTTDASGRLTLEDATVPQIRLEVPNYLAETVDLQSTTVRIDLEVDPDAKGDHGRE